MRDSRGRFATPGQIAMDALGSLLAAVIFLASVATVAWFGAFAVLAFLSWLGVIE